MHHTFNNAPAQFPSIKARDEALAIDYTAGVPTKELCLKYGLAEHYIYVRMGSSNGELRRQAKAALRDQKIRLAQLEASNNKRAQAAQRPAQAALFDQLVRAETKTSQPSQAPLSQAIDSGYRAAQSPQHSPQEIPSLAQSVARRVVQSQFANAGLEASMDQVIEGIRAEVAKEISALFDQKRDEMLQNLTASLKG